MYESEMKDDPSNVPGHLVKLISVNSIVNRVFSILIASARVFAEEGLRRNNRTPLVIYIDVRLMLENILGRC
jgi:hypothetical protein